jgi:hypothetical protein
MQSTFINIWIKFDWELGLWARVINDKEGQE